MPQMQNAILEHTPKTKKRSLNYKMRCRHCAYEYRIVVFEYYEIEHCPVCGNKDKYEAFMNGGAI